jgi:hypothetical protein
VDEEEKVRARIRRYLSDVKRKLSEFRIESPPPRKFSTYQNTRLELLSCKS